MIRTGVVSVTFRKLQPEQIIRLAAEAGLDTLEWGGDVHMPPGNRKLAEKTAAQTREAGLAVASYGSYYRVGLGPKSAMSFDPVLETAVALGAPMIRVWAGERGSQDARDYEWGRAVAETQAIAAKARENGIGISFEYHGNTLNDGPDATERLLTAIDRENVGTYWQADVTADGRTCLRHLRLVRTWLTNLHVYHWHEGKRQPLDEGANEWRGYLDVAQGTGRDHIALLEFVRDDSQQQFQKDAAILRGLVGSLRKRTPREAG